MGPDAHPCVITAQQVCDIAHLSNERFLEPWFFERKDDPRKDGTYRSSRPGLRRAYVRRRRASRSMAVHRRALHEEEEVGLVELR